MIAFKYGHEGGGGEGEGEGGESRVRSSKCKVRSAKQPRSVIFALDALGRADDRAGAATAALLALVDILPGATERAVMPAPRAEP